MLDVLRGLTLLCGALCLAVLSALAREDRIDLAPRWLAGAVLFFGVFTVLQL